MIEQRWWVYKSKYDTLVTPPVIPYELFTCAVRVCIPFKYTYLCLYLLNKVVSINYIKTRIKKLSI